MINNEGEFEGLPLNSYVSQEDGKKYFRFWSKAKNITVGLVTGTAAYLILPFPKPHGLEVPTPLNILGGGAMAILSYKIVKKHSGNKRK